MLILNMPFHYIKETDLCRINELLRRYFPPDDKEISLGNCGDATRNGPGPAVAERPLPSKISGGGRWQDSREIIEFTCKRLEINKSRVRYAASNTSHEPTQCSQVNTCTSEV